MKAKIHVTLKQGILDPQGKAIEHALDSLGFKNAGNVREQAGEAFAGKIVVGQDLMAIKL